jgi:hypothetical protein
MPISPAQIKAAVTFWSDYLRGPGTPIEEKTEELIGHNPTANREIMSSLFEFGMNNARKTAAPAIEKFAEILTILIHEMINDPHPWHYERQYVTYHCEERKEYDFKSSIEMFNEYHPRGVLREALERTSLETNINLVEEAFMLFPIKTQYIIQDDGTNRISIGHELHLKTFDTNLPTTYFNQSLNDDKHSKGRCQALLEARTAKRAKQRRLELEEFNNARSLFSPSRINQVSNFLNNVAAPLTVTAIATKVLSSTGMINNLLPSSTSLMIDSTSLGIAMSGLAVTAVNEVREIQSESNDMTAWINLGVTSLTTVALLLIAANPEQFKAGFNYYKEKIKNVYANTVASLTPPMQTRPRV